jgi:hypothetical protein
MRQETTEHYEAVSAALAAAASNDANFKDLWA